MTVDTESSAVIEITFQEVILAEAKTVTLSAAKQKNPKKTASKKTGYKQLIPSEGYRYGG